MNDIKKLYIVGAGGFGREVKWLAERINKNKRVWDICGFVDDDASLFGQKINGLSVVGNCDFFNDIQEDVYSVCAVGSPRTKKIITDKLSQYKNVHFASLIDPSVIISHCVKVGEGTIICAGTIITTNITIGSHVTINLDCTLGHDDEISDYTTLYPSVNVSGCVTIGSMTEIGTGTQIVQGKKIGSEVIIGAGSVVVKDIVKSGTYVGVPVRRIDVDNEPTDELMVCGGVKAKH